MTTSQVPHSSNLRLHRHTHAPGTWFVTKCLLPRRSALAEAHVAYVIIEALLHRVQKGTAILGGFVVMPDHWHVLVATDSLSVFMHGLDTWIGSRTSAFLHEAGAVWQHAYYETRIQTTRQFVYVRQYIEENPLRKALCGKSEEWSWSSANPTYQRLITNPWPWDFEGDHA